jgi:hypothetical protein
MATAVYYGQGAVLKMTIASVLTAIAQVVELEGPAITVGIKETTNLGSTSIRKRGQLPNSGTISGTLQFDPTDTTQTFLTTLINTWPQPPTVSEIDFPMVTGTHKAAFSAILTKFSLKGMNEEDNLEADFEMEIDGLVTWS